MIQTKQVNNLTVYTIENAHLSIVVVPALGGKITSVFNKRLNNEFLWNNSSLVLQAHNAGADYDLNFFGGIDELLPNDVPEIIDGISYPDHGELWTTNLECEITGEVSLHVFGTLMKSGLYYSKHIQLQENSPEILIEYKIINSTPHTRHFLWKLHAAVAIKEGSCLITNAKHAQVVDPEYSRFADTSTFSWPQIQGVDAGRVPENNSTMDFFYLFNALTGEMHLQNDSGDLLFGYNYDKSVFPYQWYFASYGGFLNHYTAILEPCSNMPMLVNEAIEKNQSAVLKAGEELTTTVKIFAGEKKKYFQ